VRALRSSDAAFPATAIPTNAMPDSASVVSTHYALLG
jgi:hypothetical protein